MLGSSLQFSESLWVGPVGSLRDSGSQAARVHLLMCTEPVYIQTMK